MELTILGTGNALVTECYNTCFVINDDGKYFMVDAGGGNTILRQLKKAKLKWQDMKHIFCTHKHVDHIMGIIWMVRVFGQNMARGKYFDDVYFYGHQEVIDTIRALSKMLYSKKITNFFDDKIHLITVEDGQSLKINDREVTFFDIHSTKEKQFGFTMQMNDGKKLTCCGDEPYNDTEEKYAKDAEWLLHEAFCLFKEADIFEPYKKHHSTVKDACELAQRLNVKNLVLYHTEDKNIEKREELYLDEGRQYFNGNLLVPNDLDLIKLD